MDEQQRRNLLELTPLGRHVLFLEKQEEDRNNRVGMNEDQARDADGRWTSGGGGSSGGEKKDGPKEKEEKEDKGKMPKLNKTQTDLLKEAGQSRNGVLAIPSFGGRGGDGGVSRAPNTRKREAARQMQEAGLLEFDRHETAREIKNGYHRVHTDSIYKLTDKGKQALKDLAG